MCDYLCTSAFECVFWMNACIQKGGACRQHDRHVCARLSWIPVIWQKFSEYSDFIARRPQTADTIRHNGLLHKINPQQVDFQIVPVTSVFQNATCFPQGCRSTARGGVGSVCEDPSWRFIHVCVNFM